MPMLVILKLKHYKVYELYFLLLTIVMANSNNGKKEEFCFLNRNGEIEVPVRLKSMCDVRSMEHHYNKIRRQDLKKLIIIKKMEISLQD